MGDDLQKIGVTKYHFPVPAYPSMVQYSFVPDPISRYVCIEISIHFPPKRGRETKGKTITKVHLYLLLHGLRVLAVAE